MKAETKNLVLKLLNRKAEFFENQELKLDVVENNEIDKNDTRYAQIWITSNMYAHRSNGTTLPYCLDGQMFHSTFLDYVNTITKAVGYDASYLVCVENNKLKLEIF